MQVKREDSVTSTARRAQIVDAAIATIAEIGYRQASYSKIAERAGLSSTRLISYHFDSKDELISKAISTIYTDLAAFMTARVSAATTPRAALDTYIRSLVEHIAGHRAEMRAATEIFLNFKPEGGSAAQDAATDLTVLGHVEHLLVKGQESGEFGPFNTRVMAMAIQRALDGLPFLLEAVPDADLGEYGDELAWIFARATRP
ncbi:TetR family transcriptional regulator [Nonomuraea sp. KC401]|uniref:TetR/AcrR family transcriptional regulator n=1 Tax=unclassified Nonomuraea TaxID=2593643 RepID=UPI0010FDC353|nr:MULTISPECIES: TetR/AcrR family transcriptional regulator [unclassified Nonomuraea]NBE98185.1 TetR family transcriptional regulator [Nonomuraea sp. K271]TLF61732.1 TetR family transcriptional regulator [Nonomuraea sp. KC401]